jgi:hypothetical protein
MDPELAGLGAPVAFRKVRIIDQKRAPLRLIFAFSDWARSSSQPLPPSVVAGLASRRVVVD